MWKRGMTEEWEGHDRQAKQTRNRWQRTEVSSQGGEDGEPAEVCFQKQRDHTFLEGAFWRSCRRKGREGDRRPGHLLGSYSKSL